MSEQKKTPAKVWSEENTAKVVAAYKAELNTNGPEAAADNDFLLSLAAMVGAKSEIAVRGKLSTLGEYVKPERVASVAKSNTIRKEHYVRALANTLGIDEETLDSLKNAKADSLKALTNRLGIPSVADAAKRDYVVNPEDVVDNFANALNL